MNEAPSQCQGKCCEDSGSKQQPVSTCPVSLGGVWEEPSFPVMDVSTIQQGNASSGGGPEPPRQEGCPALPRALTLQYSSMGFSLFTATSRTWLLRNRILPEERTQGRGGLGPSPAMGDSTAAPSWQVSRQSFIPGSNHSCQHESWMTATTVLPG